jgi:hypothetical protein
MRESLGLVFLFGSFALIGCSGSSPDGALAQAPGASAVALDDNHIYWTESSGVLARVSKAGGAITKLAAEEDVYAGVVLDAGFVYWAKNRSGAVARVSAEGGAPEIVIGGLGDYGANPGALAVEGGNSYWIAAGVNVLRAIYWLPSTGGTLRVLTGSSAGAMVLSSATVYFASLRLTPDDPPDEAIWSIPSAGGLPTKVAAGQTGVESMTIGGGYLFWANLDTLSAMKLPDGSPQILATGLGGPRPIATDGSSVYWTTDDAVISVALSGGAPVKVTSAHPMRASPIAVDADSVYWFSDDEDRTNQYLMKAPSKPGGPL